VVCIAEGDEFGVGMVPAEECVDEVAGPLTETGDRESLGHGRT